MPIYTFENTETEETFDLMMSDEQREEFLKDFPQCVQLLTTVNIADPIRIGVTRPPSDFLNHVIKPMKEAHPLADGLERTYTTTAD